MCGYMDGCKEEGWLKKFLDQLDSPDFLPNMTQSHNQPSPPMPAEKFLQRFIQLKANHYSEPGLVLGTPKSEGPKLRPCHPGASVLVG